MDLLTQGLIGSAMAQSASARHETRLAGVVGLLAGIAPDADTLIRSGSDPLLFLDFHRHFTHSLLFVPVVGLAVALVLWPVLARRFAFKRLFLFAVLGALLAGVLDACTSYGTQLLWPVIDRRIAWSIVSIVDPVVTLILVVGLAIAFRRSSQRAATVSLALVALYLGIGAIQHERARSATETLAASRGHSPVRIVVKPSFANVLLWRSLYVVDGRIYADGLHLAPGRTPKIYVGESAPLVDRAQAADDDDALARLGPALPRFARFSDDLMVMHPDRPEMVGDARFAMLPTRLRPLWGIAPAAPEAGYPAQFVTDRSMSSDERKQFVDMLLGRDI